MASRNEIVTVHAFASQQAAADAVRTINALLGIPASEDAETTTYTVPFQYGYGWYLRADETTIEIIGQPTQLTIQIKTPTYGS